MEHSNCLLDLLDRDRKKEREGEGRRGRERELTSQCQYTYSATDKVAHNHQFAIYYLTEWVNEAFEHSDHTTPAHLIFLQSHQYLQFLVKVTKMIH